MDETTLLLFHIFTRTTCPFTGHTTQSSSLTQWQSFHSAGIYGHHTGHLHQALERPHFREHIILTFDTEASPPWLALGLGMWLYNVVQEWPDRCSSPARTETCRGSPDRRTHWRPCYSKGRVVTIVCAQATKCHFPPIVKKHRYKQALQKYIYKTNM